MSRPACRSRSRCRPARSTPTRRSSGRARAAKGSYDIVADFGNDPPNPAKFKKDGSFDTPLDMIDGYFKPGFRVVDDPGTMGEFANVGFFQVNASLLASYGIGPSMTVEDESKPYFNPADFVPLNATIPRVATVRFPADTAGCERSESAESRATRLPAHRGHPRQRAQLQHLRLRARALRAQRLHRDGDPDAGWAELPAARECFLRSPQLDPHDLRRAAAEQCRRAGAQSRRRGRVQDRAAESVTRTRASGSRLSSH